MKVNAEKGPQLEYLRRQLDQAMRNNQRELLSSRSMSMSHSVDEESKSNPFGTSEEDEAREPRIRREASDPTWTSRWRFQSLRANLTQMSSWIG